jgi:hypothetical protein
MRFSRSDAAVSAAVLLGVAGLLYLFVLDMNAYSSRVGERSLGTVVFKKLSATRKAPSGLGWERMRNNSPVFNMDTLRTAGFSEATVNFDDGTSLDIFENSMLKLDFGAQAKDLEFLSGEISVGSSREGTSYTISGAVGRIDVDKGSKATFSRDADRLSVEVSQGSASLVRSDGSSQAISQDQELQVDVKSGEAKIVERPLLATKPERNARLLCASEARSSIDFAWKLEGSPASAAEAAERRSYELDISASKDFEDPAIVLRNLGTGTRVPIAGLAGGGRAADKGEEGKPPAALGDGTWYWRVRDDRGRESQARRFSLVSAAPPRPIFPDDKAAYAYRRIKPDIRFSWTGMDAAGVYLFEIASDANFSKPAVRTRATTTSLSVSDLGEGSWYWRVKPVHAFETVGRAEEAEVRSFRIDKSAEMAALSPSSPVEGSLYQIQDAEGKGLAFAWEPQQEAVSYELLVSRSKDLSSPLMSVPAKQAYLKLSGAECAALRKAGSYYWGLRWRDREGNVSPASAARSLTGIDGSIAIRLSFPPEGYRIADSLVSNTRFAWKTNVPARTEFQVAGDRGFEGMAYKETVSADTLIGRAWPSGRYWWRLRTYNVDGSVFLETQPRGFEVVDPFPGVELAKPAPGALLYLRDREQTEFSWKPIPFADYYKVTLRSSADGYAAPLLERGLVEGTSLPFALGELPSGSYRLSIQAFAAASPVTTRIIGYIADHDFTYKRITRIKLASPAEGDRLPGLDARRGKAVFAYEHEDRLDEASIVVSSDPWGTKIVARVDARSGSAKVGRLDPGHYYWTALGKLAGFDVSAEKRASFAVEPPPPLPAPEPSAPAPGTIIGPAELREKRSILLSWSQVAGATHYRLSVFSQGKKEPILVKDELRETEYLIEDLTVLDRGDTTWKVEAIARDAAGEIEQGGIEGKSSFTIDLPAVKKAKPSGGGKAYGR